MRALARRAQATADRAIRGFFDDGSPQSAAAISYYALFSLFPLAILLVVGFGLVVDDDAARARVIDFVLENVPLREDRGRAELEELLTSVTDDVGGFGVLGVVGLVVAASGVMGAVRKALNVAWDVGDARPLLQAKAIDVLLVAGLGLLITVSVALTFISQLASPVMFGLGRLVPLVVAFLAFLTLFRVVPAAATTLRGVWPGAAVAALGFEATKSGFGVYLENFANYNAVYASLAAIVAFLVFMFVSANVVLLGAQVAVEWPRACDDEPSDSGAPLSQRLRDALAGLVVRRSGDPPAKPR